MCRVCVHLHRCQSQLCHSSEQHIAGVGLLHVCSVKLLLQQNSHTPPPSLPLLLPPFASFNFFLSLLNLYASIPPLAIRSLFLNYFQLAAFLLSLTLSHTFSPFHTLILVSFASSLRCPSPSLLIRAICWRGRQSDLRMDRIVLYVESVVQCWSQSCAYMRGNVAHMLVFV